MEGCELAARARGRCGHRPKRLRGQPPPAGRLALQPCSESRGSFRRQWLPTHPSCVCWQGRSRPLGTPGPGSEAPAWCGSCSNARRIKPMGGKVLLELGLLAFWGGSRAPRAQASLGCKNGKRGSTVLSHPVTQRSRTGAGVLCGKIQNSFSLGPGQESGRAQSVHPGDRPGQEGGRQHWSSTRGELLVCKLIFQNRTWRKNRRSLFLG